MMILILSSQPVNARQAMEALKVAAQVVKEVTQPPPGPHAAKPPAASAIARQSSAQQWTMSSQVGPSRGRDKPLTSVSKEYSGKLLSFHGQHYQKQEFPPHSGLSLDTLSIRD